MSAPTPRILIFDKTNTLQDIPPDVLSVSFETVVNGGSGQGTIKLPRLFNDIGAIDEGYRVQFYLPDDLSTPWYDGRVTEIDRKILVTRGEVQVSVEGYATSFEDAEATFSVNPGIQPNGVDNGQMDYGTLMTWLIQHYAPAGFDYDAIGVVGVNVDTLNVNHQGLSTTLDTVTKCILDGNGAHWEWYCDGHADLSKRVTVQSVEVFAKNPLQFDQLSDLAEYDLRANFRTIKNMLVLYGGTDPSTQELVWGPYTDVASIAKYGVRQAEQNVNELVSTDQLNQYASSWLAQNSSPTYTGSFLIQIATSKARAGKWAIIFEPPGTLRTVRLGKVRIEYDKGTYIKQTCEPNAPIPRIDKALFVARHETAAQSAARSARPIPNSLGQATTVVAGGDLGAFH
jgi:hypothetical protein